MKLLLTAQQLLQVVKHPQHLCRTWRRVYRRCTCSASLGPAFPCNVYIHFQFTIRIHRDIFLLWYATTVLHLKLDQKQFLGEREQLHCLPIWHLHHVQGILGYLRLGYYYWRSNFQVGWNNLNVLESFPEIPWPRRLGYRLAELHVGNMHYNLCFINFAWNTLTQFCPPPDTRCQVRGHNPYSPKHNLCFGHITDYCFFHVTEQICAENNSLSY